eukprot:CAMPEP_0194298014 /NCGR_PEP_ID=MMETSP0169-20130528/59927_1 /TAXON_ID=218684 /ORGANISM="Corethron pennatum, Strain L29A3" /LENGTH=56 /DNA_ID=CAMNT_0039047947 /DNA_START=611 /DNA_END=781 /DNA_ORIENTATION=-
MVLGYTRTSWDAEEPCGCEDKAWDDLSAAEKAAAIVLGYDQEHWDVEDESESEDDD